MSAKHGLNQYRINHAKSQAQEVLETINKVEMVFQLSKQGHMDEQLAENFTARNIKELDRSLEYLKGHIEQREDMR